jgi:hypothetical protein
MERAKIINLTPHAVTILAWCQTLDGDTVIPPSGQVARCEEVTNPNGMIETEFGQIEFVQKSFGAVVGLPEQEPGTYLIVSMMVRQALPERKDLLSPGDLVRDTSGKIVGCKNLACN